jgi:hypothetical protein
LLVTTHNVLDPINLTALIQTLQDYLMAGMMQAYPNTIFDTVTLEASPNESDSNSTKYSDSIVFFDVQAEAQALMLDMATVQAAVDGNPDIAPNQSARARIEQIIVGNMSAVALSSFTVVLVAPDVVDQVQLTMTLEQY